MGKSILLPIGVKLSTISNIQKEFLRLGTMIMPNYLLILFPVEFQGKVILVI